jgi:hypothetical protein
LQFEFNITFFVALAVLSMTHNDKSNNVTLHSSDSVIDVDDKFLAEQLLLSEMDPIL